MGPACVLIAPGLREAGRVASQGRAGELGCVAGDEVRRTIALLATLASGCVMAPEEGIGELADPGPAVGVDPCPIPEDGFGTSVGRYVAPFELSDCEGDVVGFYDASYCDARATVLFMNTGWCAPSRVHASTVNADLVEPFAGQGVRILEVLVQDNDFGAPDAAFCEGWASMYAAGYPVLIDPTQISSAYFPGGVFPAVLVADGTGRIRYRGYGVDGDHAMVAAVLREVLAEGP